MALSLCASSVDNIGELACDKSRGVAKKLFIFNGSIAEADYTTADELFAKLVANSKLSKSDSDKIFVINEVQEVTDASEANTEGTLGLGFKAIIREGRPAYTMKIFAGADLLKRLRTWNNQTIRVLEYDANGTLWGVLSGTDFKGFQAKLFFSGGKLATGQNVEEGVVTVTLSILSNSEYLDNPVWVSLSGNNVEDIVPLIDVNMALVSNASNVHQISMKIPDSNLIEDFNIFDDFGTAIAALSANFSAESSEDGALTITSITANSTLKTLAVTYDSTQYSAISAGTITLTPPTPAQLDAGDAPGIELLPVTYTKP